MDIDRSQIIAWALLATVFFLLAAGLYLGWPLATPFVAVFRLLRWTLTAVYVCVPVVAVGRLINQTFLGRKAGDGPLWALAEDWLLGWAAVVAAGMGLLAAGWYSVWVWMTLALGVNLAVAVGMVARRGRPLVEFYRHKWPRLAADLFGNLSGDGSGWNWALIGTLTAVWLYALLPPIGRDEVGYHLLIPQLWGFQHHWWMPSDNYHLMFPANVEIIWGYALAAGGIFVPRMITLIFGLLTLGALRAWMRTGGFLPWVQGAGLVFLLLTPLMVTTLSLNYVEWPALFFLFLGYRSLKRYVDTAAGSHLLRAAIAWGVCAGAKYTLIPLTGLLAIDCLFQAVRRIGPRRAAVALAVLLAGGVLYSAPWLLRNYAATSDPVFPLGRLVPGDLFAHGLSQDVRLAALTHFEKVPGAWRWVPWGYQALADPTADNRLHLGWPILLFVVLLFGWKRRKTLPWLTIALFSIAALGFSPAPRIHFPVMGLAWLFLPRYLARLAETRPVRRLLSGLLVFLAASSFVVIGYHLLALPYGKSIQDFRFGLVDLKTALEGEGVLTPAVRWVRDQTRADSRLWVWGDDQVFYFDRWVRPSSPYDIPACVQILARRGTRGLTEEIEKDRIDYIVVNRASCPFPPSRPPAPEWRRYLPEALWNQLEEWGRNHLLAVGQDTRFQIYRVRPRSETDPGVRAPDSAPATVRPGRGGEAPGPEGAAWPL